MARDKKGFLMYADQRHIFDKLPDELAGKLIKHLFSYVNDESPIHNELIIEIAFESIKQQLKRDLESYENVRAERSKAGKLGGRPKKAKKAIGLFEKQSEAKKADSVNDNVNVNDKDNDTKEIKGDKPTVFNFKESLIALGVSKEVATDWTKVRSKKRASNTITSFNRIKSQIAKSGLSANDCIKIAVERDWKGFEAEWAKNNTPKREHGFFKSEDVVKYTDEL